MYRKIEHLKGKMQKKPIRIGNVWFKQWSPKKERWKNFKCKASLTIIFKLKKTMYIAKVS